MSIDIGHIQKVQRDQAPQAGQSTPIFKRNIFESTKLSDKKKAFIYKNLATLLNAGIDFEMALTIVRDQQKNKAAKMVMGTILTHIIKGKAFYEAMQLTERFTPYEVFSVRIGEETRKLDNILDELQKYFERKVKLKKQVISILTYPFFILILTFATMYFMLTYVVPLFKSVFNQFNRELPTLTRYVIDLSENFNTLFLLFAVGVLAGFLFFQKVKSNTTYKRISSKLFLRIPFFGKLIKDIYITRFCQSMALLLVSKTSLIESLNLVKQMIAYYPIENALQYVQRDIERGHTLGDSLAKFKIFDANIVSMVRVAEQVNQLDSMFLNLANQYEAEVEHKTKVMGTIIEPMLILFIGGIVGLIMIAMYAPMFDLSEVIGGSN